MYIVHGQSERCTRSCQEDQLLHRRTRARDGSLDRSAADGEAIASRGPYPPVRRPEAVRWPPDFAHASPPCAEGAVCSCERRAADGVRTDSTDVVRSEVPAWTLRPQRDQVSVSAAVTDHFVIYVAGTVAVSAGTGPSRHGHTVDHPRPPARRCLIVAMAYEKPNLGPHAHPRRTRQPRSPHRAVVYVERSRSALDRIRYLSRGWRRGSSRRGSTLGSRRAARGCQVRSSSIRSVASICEARSARSSRSSVASAAISS